LVLGSVGIATVVFFFLPTEGQSLLDNAIAVSAAVAMFAGIAWNRPEPRFAWVLVALGIVLFAAGDIAFGSSAPVPSVADMFYVSAYPLLGLGLLALARSRLPGPNGSPAFDALLVTAGVAVVTLVILLVPAGQERGVGTITRLVSIGYPAMDLVLLGVMARPVRLAAARGLPCILTGLALLLRLVGDTGYALQDYGTAYTLGNALDACWLLSFACFGAALLHPAVSREGALARPSGSAWTTVPAFTRVAGIEPDDSSVVLRGVTGRPVVIAGVAALPAAGELVAEGAWVAVTQSVRFRLILVWSSLMLLSLAGMALLVAFAWQAPDVVVLAGAYGITGSLTFIASAIRS
jgi:hypothetical protein